MDKQWIVSKTDNPRYFSLLGWGGKWMWGTMRIPVLSIHHKIVSYYSHKEELYFLDKDIVDVKYIEPQYSFKDALLITGIFILLVFLEKPNLYFILIIVGYLSLLHLFFSKLKRNNVMVSFIDSSGLVQTHYFRVVYYLSFPRQGYVDTIKLYKDLHKLYLVNHRDNMEIDLSIIIISFNTKKLTFNSIKSVVDDTSVKNKEIIVVDNGSSDGSVEEIEKLTKKNNLVQLIKNNSNLGFSVANNQGIKIAKGKYVLLLNSDTLVSKGSLKKLIDFAEKTEDAGVIGPQLLNEDGSIQDSCFNFPTIRRAINQYWFKTDKALDKYAPKHKSPITVDAVVGAAFLITPQAFEKVGGLDERYFFFYEDLDYCRLVNKSGLKVYYLPTVQITHLHGASGSTVADSDNQWRRLIPSSKIYHGTFKHYLFNFVLWSSQKWKRISK